MSNSQVKYRPGDRRAFLVEDQLPGGMWRGDFRVKGGSYVPAQFLCRVEGDMHYCVVSGEKDENHFYKGVYHPDELAVVEYVGQHYIDATEPHDGYHLWKPVEEGEKQ